MHDFLGLVEIFLPAALLIENVSGFVQGPVTALGEIERRLATVNDRHGTLYKAGYRVVNALDYGVPQRRRRAILVALRDGSHFRWPLASHTDTPVRAWDALRELDTPDPAPAAVGKWAPLLPSIPEGENYLWHTERGGGRPLFGYRTRFWSFLLKLAKDQPSWTLPAQPGPATGPFHWDNRPLTIPEMLRLQSFPADWMVEGDLRDQVRQVGNATPPLLAEKIGRALFHQLYNRSFCRVPVVHQIDRAKTVPSPEFVADVPAAFKQLEGEHAPHAGTGKGPRPRVAAGTPQETDLSHPQVGAYKRDRDPVKLGDSVIVPNPHGPRRI